MRRAPAKRAAGLPETLETLRSYGLLDRTLKLRVGEVELLMDVKAPEAEPETNESDKARTEREELEMADKLYGAARGGIPGAH